MNSRLTFIVSLFLLISSSVSSQIKGQDDSTKINLQHYLFNRHPGLLLHSVSQYSFRHGTNFSGKFKLKPEHQKISLLRIDNPPLFNITNNRDSSNTDYYHEYDSMNPYGASNPGDAVFLGSINYLLWKLFDEK